MLFWYNENNLCKYLFRIITKPARGLYISVCEKSFSSTGIWPYNPGTYSKLDFLPAEVTYRENPNEEDVNGPITIEQIDQPLETAISSSRIVPVLESEEGFHPSCSQKKLLLFKNQRKSNTET